MSEKNKLSTEKEEDEPEVMLLLSEEHVAVHVGVGVA